MNTPDPASLSPLIAASLGQHAERVRQKVHALLAPLSHEQLWKRPYGYGNSAGHLVLHLTGNLNYYIGARIARTGYVRDRPKEFADDSRRTKEDILRDLDAAVDMVLSTLKVQGDADWSAPFEGVGAEDVKTRLAMFVRCVAHLDHHTGQMIYLVKELTPA